MQEKVILVTGAAKRLGAAIARTLHATGARMAIHCNRSIAEANHLAAELNGLREDSARVFQCALGDEAVAARLIADVVGAFGKLDGLVNNASTFYATPVGTITGAQWDDVISSNLKAPLFLSQAAAAHLSSTHGAIVNIVDIHADRPLKNFVVYNIAKSGLAGLTRSLALELGPQVRVNGVAPGAILWPEDGKHDGKHSGKPNGKPFNLSEQQRIVEQTPLKRVGSPEDVAGAVKYLLLDAPFVTGQILAVDGGRQVVV